MSNKKIVVLCLFLIVCFSVLPHVLGRTWTATNGHTREGEFVKVEGDTVHIALPSGGITKVKLNQLCAADQKFTKEQSAAKEVPKPDTIKAQSPSMASSNDSADTISVTAIGVGKDADAALKAALRAAVEQAVGSLVDAKTLVENDELVQDKILTLSGGFVKTHKQIGEPKTRDDGLISIRIAAEVKRGELDSHLVKAGFTQKPVDWESLFGERLTKVQSLEDGIDMLKDMIEEHLLNCISVTTGDARWDQEKRKVVLEIQTAVDYEKYSSFAKRFTEVLKKMGVKYDGEGTLPLERVTISPTYYRVMWTDIGNYVHGYEHPATKIGEDNNLDRNRKVNKRALYIATTRWRDFTTAGAKKQEMFGRYVPPSEVFDEIRNSLLTVKNKSIFVELLDDEKKTVAKDKVLSCGPCYVDRGSDEPGILLFPSLFRNGYTDSFLHWGNIIPKFWPGTPVYREDIYFDIPMEDLKRIRSIQIRYGNDTGDGAAERSGSRAGW